jgi:hypothetical protein
MSVPCYNHPETTAVGTCVSCGLTFCTDCIRKVGNVLACVKCAPKVASHQGVNTMDLHLSPGPTGYLNNQVNPGYAPPKQSVSQASPPPQAPSYGGPPQMPFIPAGQSANARPAQQPYPAPNQQPYPASYQQSYAPPPQPGYRSSLGQWEKKYEATRTSADFIKGLLLASVVGIIGSILVLKLLFYAHFGLSYLYILVGYGIGWGMWACYGNGGAKTMVATMSIYVVSLFIAHLVYVNDIMSSMQADYAGVTLMQAFVPIVSSMSILHWICIAGGFVACWKAESRISSV